MEVIEHDDGFGEMLRHGLDVGIGHVDSYGLNSCPGLFHAFEKRIQGLGIFAIPDENHCSGAQIQHNRHEPVSFADGNLINCDSLEMAERWPGEFPHEVPFLDVLDHIPTDSQMPCRGQLPAPK